MGELAGLQEDLVDEFSGGGHNEGLGLLELTEAAGRHTVRHQLLQDGQQEGRLHAERTRQRNQ